MTLGERPHVIDEWQLVPIIRDSVRREVDKEPGLHGGWILTGSSSLLNRSDKEGPKHNGAGRIGRVRMFPMSLAESGDSTRTVSLSGLFDGTFTLCILDEDSTEATKLIELACRGGWPEALDLDAARAQSIAREHLRALLVDTVPRQGGGSEIASRLLSPIARTLGQSATQAILFSDMNREPLDSALNSSRLALVSTYLRILRSIYVLEEVPGWAPPASSPKWLSVKPERHLADPSLPVAQLGMGTGSLLHDWQTSSAIFGNLCMRNLVVYASAFPTAAYQPVRYYRDDTGLEVNTILELADSEWAATVIKTSEDKVRRVWTTFGGCRKLCENAGTRTQGPAFMAVLVGLSRFAREVEKGLYVISIRAFCPLQLRLRLVVSAGLLEHG